MSKPLLPLCSIPKLASRDAWAGNTAKLFLYGSPDIFFFNGATYTFPNATLKQVPGPFALVGTRKPNNYVKDCCSGNPGCI
jgi:hypothetical protein